MNTVLLLQGCAGILFFLGVSWLVSENRKAINLKHCLMGVVIQAVLAVLLLKAPYVHDCFISCSHGIMALKDATTEGTKFVFGYLGGSDLPFELKQEASAFIFAFGPLPMVMVISALAMLLFHWKILPFLVRILSKAFSKSLGIGGALGVCCGAKVFLGQTEAPLLVRPYMNSFSRSELFTIMTAGMATTSATIIVLYATLLESVVSNPIIHILTASIISIPASIVLSRLMIPQTTAVTNGEMVVPYKFSSSMEAISQGTSDGLQMFLGILAMVVVMLALVALANSILGVLPPVMGHTITLQWLFGLVLTPVTWLMGMPWGEAQVAANILGTKTVLNEVIAFIDLSKVPHGSLSEGSLLIMTYALCGFANLSSIGIQIAGLGTMAPERKKDIIDLAPKALLAGTMASCMSGTLVGILHRLF